jgi:hypothetical protein
LKALRLHAGPTARRHLAQNGLRPQDIGVIPGAAGGPKGLILGPLDRFIFGQWLQESAQPVHLVGASIGAWRMATACLSEPVQAFERLERDYIHQHYKLQPGQKRPSAQFVSDKFGDSLTAFFGGRVQEVLHHPRFRLHVVTSRGRHVLGREHRIATPLGYAGAFLSNLLRRQAMGSWLERVVFSAPVSGEAGNAGAACAPLPFATGDYRTRQIQLTAANFNPALQASCSIPFVLRAVHDIPGAPPGAYWDGGITDYHLHLDYAQALASRKEAGGSSSSAGLVLYPHFQQAVVPGWLDKSLKWRHGATAFLDNMLLLAPSPEWVKTLPNGKLPDRSDFTHYGNDLPGRVKAWQAASKASEQLADELQEWLLKPDMGRVHAL